MLTFNKQETIKVKWFIDEEIISKEQKPTEGFRGKHWIWFWRCCKSFLEKYKFKSNLFLTNSTKVNKVCIIKTNVLIVTSVNVLFQMKNGPNQKQER